MANPDNVFARPALEKQFRACGYSIISPKLGQTARYAYGPNAVIHSEPNMSDCHRMFIYIIFAAEKDIK